MNISDGLGDVLELDDRHGRLTISVDGEAGFVLLDAAGEAALRDYLAQRWAEKREEIWQAHVAHDKALRVANGVESAS